jgi:SAM-dependent methyltransferase
MTLARLCEARPDIRAFAFDVTDAYVPFWSEAMEPGRFATHHIPASWSESFDVVLAFFVLEHVEDPVGVLEQLRGLLTPTGTLWTLVPNPFANVADLVVLDHVNHFTPSSLRAALGRAGFSDAVLDVNAHFGAFAVAASRAGAAPPPRVDSAEAAGAFGAAAELAAWWRRVRRGVAAIEEQLGGRPAAIYGAGWWGSFVRSSLGEGAPVRCFVDRNPHLHGRTHHGVLVTSPAALPDDVADVIVALNPLIARNAVAEIQEWSGRALAFHFLD